MKKSTRITTLALSLLIAIASMAGCSHKSNNVSSNAGSSAVSKEEDKLEPVTLKIFMRDGKTPDDSIVSAAISELPEVKALNVTVELVKYANGEFKDKLPLLLASNEQMDMGFDASFLDYVGRSESNAYLDITDMLDTVTPKLKEAIPQNLWDGAKIKDRIYGVPTYKEMGEQWGIFAETDFLKQINVDPTSIKTLEDAEVILEKMKEDKRAGFQVIPKSRHSEMNRATYFDTIANIACISREEKNTVVNYYETPEYASFLKLMRSWYQKGYIQNDVATREKFDEFTTNGIYKQGITFVSYSPQAEVINSASYGKDLTFMPLTDVTISTAACQGSLFGIYSKCKNPERALQFLEVWNTVPEVKNMITFGIEGTHYNLVDGQVEKVKDADKMYSSQNWTTGNSMISYTMVGETKDKWEQYELFNQKGSNSLCLGFTVNNDSIADKITACNAVIAEYNPLLQCGAVDPEEILPKFIKALKDAGSDDIIVEYQKQFDDWKKQ